MTARDRRRSEHQSVLRRELRQLIIADLAARRGLCVEAFGQAYRVVGYGVDLLVIDLGVIDARDLEPVLP